MITKSHIKSIDHKYFVITTHDLFSISLKSNNSGDCWTIMECERNHKVCFMIFHAHDYFTPRHLHAYAQSLEHAIWKIQKHDAYQINGRVRLSKEKLENFKNEYSIQ